MNVNLKSLQISLAKQKVYDAWQYVESLTETLTYMEVSCALLNEVYTHRRKALKTQEKKIMETAFTTGEANISKDDLNCTNIDIFGLSLDDSILLRKSTIEFFHYARMSMDILFQIINAALLGDQSYEATDRKLINNVICKLKSESVFSTLSSLLDSNKNDPRFIYLQSFDNYIKHIKTISVVVKNSFLLGDCNEFLIKEFMYNDVSYPQENAISKINEIKNYVINTVENILMEVESQLPNCLDNNSRIQKISFKQVMSGETFKYISFFIDVENDLSELPSEIKVLPLLVKPNDEIYSFDFRFDKIFIRKKDSKTILGCAELKNGLETNEIYRVFEVKPCTINKYTEYKESFLKNFPKIKINYYAMEGSFKWVNQ